jgi:hypothetical protein
MAIERSPTIEELPDKTVRSSVYWESARAEGDPNSPPARRWAYGRTGMMDKLIAVKSIPIVEGRASPKPDSANRINGE